MKAILINPHVPLSVVYGEKLAGTGAVVPPLGLLYLMAHLERRGKHKADLLDANVLELSAERTVGRAAGYDCVGLSATTLAYPYAVDIARRLKEKYPGVIIALGGAHAQSSHEEILKTEGRLFDYVCYGEGEYAFERLLDHLEGTIGRNEIESMSFSENGRVTVNPPALIPEDLDVFGHPADMIPREYVGLYHEKILAYKSLPFFTMISSRGCPFHCTFCSTPRKFAGLYKNKMRCHSVNWICEEMLILRRKFGVKETAFMDDTFNLSKERVTSLCGEILRRGIKMSWTCNFKAHISDMEMLLAMKKAGCWGIMAGAESGSDRILSLIKKGVTAAQIYKLSVEADEAGMFTRASFILGLPGDTCETVRETLRFAKKCRFHFPYFQLYMPFPGTEMFGSLERFGKIIVSDPKKMSASRVNYLPTGLSEAYLQNVFNSSHKEVFLRPDMIRRHFKFLRSFADVRRYWTGFLLLIGRN
jgi:radical SAM superfamily enzyme YgiQ (UPF0313 family)